MKRTWDIEELVEHFTLVSADFGLLGNKTGVTRLGFALLLKCFQYEGHFPAAKQDIPRVIVDYVANQLRLEASLYAQYDWTGRTITNHRTQIRDHFGFRDATSADFDEMTAWLIATGKAASAQMERLKETVDAQFRGNSIWDFPLTCSVRFPPKGWPFIAREHLLKPFMNCAVTQTRRGTHSWLPSAGNDAKKSSIIWLISCS